MLRPRSWSSLALASWLVLAAAACGADATPRAPTPTDDFGDTISLDAPPARRIVSLDPAVTELLVALGAADALVGRTRYDTFLPRLREVPDLGPGLRPNVEAVLAARPDLVLLYASNENRPAARRLREAGVRTAAFRVDRLADLSRVTRVLGRLTGDTAAARLTIDTTAAALARVRARTAALPHPTVFWHLWDTPLLGVGGGSWLDDLVTAAGGRNVYHALRDPSPVITFEDLLRRDPDVILAGARTRDRLLRDPRWSGLRAVRTGRVLAVDSTIVNGPSPRVGSSAAEIARLLHPELAR